MLHFIKTGDDSQQQYSVNRMQQMVSWNGLSCHGMQKSVILHRFTTDTKRQANRYNRTEP